jgi:hypothetical protein
MDSHASNKRELLKNERAFERKQKFMNELLADLYDLGDDDLLIPLIKDFYEAT